MLLLIWFATISVAFTRVGGFSVPCGFSWKLAPHESLTLTNPGYPANFTAPLNCTHKISGPPGYRKRISCSELSVSTCSTGNQVKANTDIETSVCPATNYTRNSVKEALQMEFYFGTGTGRYNCTAVLDTDPCQCGKLNANSQPADLVLVMNATSVPCGGTIITERHVLSAASCMKVFNISSTFNTTIQQDLWIIAGSGTTSNQGYVVIRTTTHPGYDAATGANDVAILETGNRIIMDPNVSVACLPTPLVGVTLVPGVLTVQIDFKALAAATVIATCPVGLPGICTNSSIVDGCAFRFGSGAYFTDGGPTTYMFGLTTGRNCTASSTGVVQDIRPALEWIKSQTESPFCNKTYVPLAATPTTPVP